MNMETLIGIAASKGTALSLMPQLIKVIKEKEARDVSIVMMLILFAGIGLWIIYGILKNDWIIIISNAFSFIINLLLGIFTLKYKKK
jgi:MtN3 and saliva related transmembrane protein